LGVLPTGGGKSLCYQLPAHLTEGLTLVLTPLISLIDDQVRRAQAVGLCVAGLSSSRSSAENRAALDRARAGRLDILFLAPERLAAAPMQRLLMRRPPALIVVDEAHCISLWGMDFRPAYRKIGRWLEPRRSPILALTATATPAVREDISQVLGLVRPKLHVASFDRPELFWSVRRLQPRDAKAPAVAAAVARHSGARLVYAATRRSVRVLHAYLSKRGWHARPYHAGLSAGVRSEAQEWFVAAESPILVATNAFGMGIDRPDVRLVVHESLPLSLEAYYQEAGRAGRDGALSEVLALTQRGDRRRRRALLDRSRLPPREVVRAHKRLLAYAGAHGAFGDERLLKALGPAWSGRLPALKEALVVGGVAAPTDPDAGVRLTPGALRWDPLVQRRKAGMRGIRAVERFAGGRRCRRRALLGFFGERAPRHCGACDRCRPGGPDWRGSGSNHGRSDLRSDRRVPRRR